MLPESIAIPVEGRATVDDIRRDVLVIQGLLSYRDGVLKLECQTLDRRLKKAPVRTFELPLRELQDVEIRNRVVDRIIVIRTKHLSFIEDIPGSDHGRLELKVRWKHRAEADRFVSYVRLALSELRIDLLEQGEEGI